ncbi:MAG: VWA domain-containing protein [Alphaproteobacteria bacterium]
MKRSRRRETEIFSMSFLDVVSCGFGAVILLLVIALALEPATVRKITEDLRGAIIQRNDARQQHAQDSFELAGQLAEQERVLAALRKELNQAESQAASAAARAAGAAAQLGKQEEKAEELAVVRQLLSEEMKRLLNQPGYTPPKENAVIGGIPVDSEYILFIIDTSGSMRQFAWPLVVQKVQEVLRVYPKVKGIQVMNDMGRYMFETYSGRWIPDTPSRRRAVIDRLKGWNSFSNSSPVEGIVAAIRGFYRKDRRISLYVFGDDFTGRNITNVVEEVARINALDQQGRPRVRIHAFGFPVLFLSAKHRANRERFAHLMRVLAERNAGSFVGLNDLGGRAIPKPARAPAVPWPRFGLPGE